MPNVCQALDPVLTTSKKGRKKEEGRRKDERKEGVRKERLILSLVLDSQEKEQCLFVSGSGGERGHLLSPVLIQVSPREETRWEGTRREGMVDMTEAGGLSTQAPMHMLQAWLSCGNLSASRG